jgi:hypothetical protein
MADTTSPIQTHDASDGMIDRLLKALEEAGHDISNLSVERLNLVAAKRLA